MSLSRPAFFVRSAHSALPIGTGPVSAFQNAVNYLPFAFLRKNITLKIESEEEAMLFLKTIFMKHIEIPWFRVQTSTDRDYIINLPNSIAEWLQTIDKVTTTNHTIFRIAYNVLLSTVLHETHYSDHMWKKIFYNFHYLLNHFYMKHLSLREPCEMYFTLAKGHIKHFQPLPQDFFPTRSCCLTRVTSILNSSNENTNSIETTSRVNRERIKVNKLPNEVLAMLIQKVHTISNQETQTCSTSDYMRSTHQVRSLLAMRTFNRRFKQLVENYIIYKAPIKKIVIGINKCLDADSVIVRSTQIVEHIKPVTAFCTPEMYESLRPLIDEKSEQYRLVAETYQNNFEHLLYNSDDDEAYEAYQDYMNSVTIDNGNVFSVTVQPPRENDS